MNLLATRARKPSTGPKPAALSVSGPVIKKEDNLPTLDDLIANQDYTGAVTLLEFLMKTGDGSKDTKPWLAYAYFHLGEFQKALDIYTDILILNASSLDTETQTYYLYKAACLYFLGDYQEAINQARRGPSNMLQNRILLHCSQKLNDTTLLEKCTQMAQKGGPEDLLSLASLQYASAQYQDATDAYHSLIKEHPHFDSINIYLALCCYKLDHYKFALEFLNKYLQKNPSSASAMNLRGCCLYKLFDSAAASAQLHELSESFNSTSLPSPPIVAHNTVVVRSGENALQVLPPLLDIIPECRINLVIYHLLQDNLPAAYALVKDYDPVLPQEYIIKGVCYACMAVDEVDDDLRQQYLTQSEIFLQAVGSSASEKDTIPGRKCMAQVYFFQQKWNDVILYLTSIEEYCGYDPALNYNLGIAYAANGDFEDALQRLRLVEGPLTASPAYISWLCRSLIYTGDCATVWQMYLDSDTSYSLGLLKSIASDFYKCGHFYYAAKAYDMLCKLDENDNYIEGRRGACLGVVQAVLAGNEGKEVVKEIINMLQHPQDMPVQQAIEDWYRSS